MSPLTQALDQHGLALAFLVLLAEQLGLPLPAYPVLIVTGALGHDGRVPAAALFIGAVCACLIADLAWFAGGRRYGSAVLRTICRISLSPDSCVRQTESLFTRWGAGSLLVAKFIPGFGTIATVLCGRMRVPFGRFLAMELAGASLYVGVGLGLGWVFHDAVDEVIAVFAEMGRWGLFVGVAALVLFLCAKWWQRHRLISELRMARITVPELEQLIDGGAAPAIIDVRSESTRRRDGSIRGALAWPVHAGADGAPDLARDLEVVVYCACPNEVSAALVARQLREAGFTHVRPLHGGIDAWIAAGLPVERGEAAPAA